MYKEGEVKALTFEWNIKERKWLSNEAKVTLRYGHRMSLEKILKDILFVSAATCGDKELQRLVLLYVESDEWPEPPPPIV